MLDNDSKLAAINWKHSMAMLMVILLYCHEWSRHGSKSRSLSLTQRALRWICRNVLEPTRVIRAKRYIKTL